MKKLKKKLKQFLTRQPAQTALEIRVMSYYVEETTIQPIDVILALVGSTLMIVYIWAKLNA